MSGSRCERALTLSVIFGVTAAGFIGGTLWPAIPMGSVVLLFAGDRGQHRELAERAWHVPRERVLWISIIVHLLNNLFFCALAFGMGRITQLFWWEVLAGCEGAVGDLGSWLVYEVGVLGVGQLAWHAFGRRCETGRWW